MAKATKSKKKPIGQYDHKGKRRVNNPPVGLVTPETDKETGKKKYAYDPHLDPQLVWSGKAERPSFEVPMVSLHVHERIDPRTIIEAVRRRNVWTVGVKRDVCHLARISCVTPDPHNKTSDPLISAEKVCAAETVRVPFSLSTKRNSIEKYQRRLLTVH